MIKIPESILKLINLKEETASEIKTLALKENAVFLALIAPYTSVRVSPIEEHQASLGLSEEFAVEAAIGEIKARTDCKKLYLLLNSPGGLVTSSYKIAKALRQNFEDITIFIPHLAASGGTIIALSGNRIVMGMMSQLSPIDAQIPYQDEFISTAAFPRAIDWLEHYFKNKEPEEAPYPYQAMSEKLDPAICQQWIGVLNTVRAYASELLNLSGYDTKKSQEIAHILAYQFHCHDCVINFDRAKEIGLNVVRDEKYPEIWAKMRDWLGNHMLEVVDKHVVRFAIPAEISTKKA